MIYSSGFFDKVGIRQSLDPVTSIKYLEHTSYCPITSIAWSLSLKVTLS